MRYINHPGPPAVGRVEVVETQLRPVTGHLAPGRSVMEAVDEIFAAAGCIGGVARLVGGAAKPFRYVIPALATDGQHAAWYSDPHTPDGLVAITDAVLSFGRREGKPFLHCHGMWHGADGKRRMGHMLPFDCQVSEAIALEGFGSPSALFDAVLDTETDFTLFTPRKVGSEPGKGVRGLFVRVLPNEDILTAIEGIAAAYGISEARLHGIGSLNGVAFTDGRHVASLATELMVTNGQLDMTPEGLRANLAVAVVDIDGSIQEGILTKGDNPVCVTFELMFEVLERAG